MSILLAAALTLEPAPQLKSPPATPRLALEPRRFALQLEPAPRPTPPWAPALTILGSGLLASGVVVVSLGAFQAARPTDYTGGRYYFNPRPQGRAMIAGGAAVVFTGAILVAVGELLPRRHRPGRLALALGRDYWGLNLTRRF